MTVSTIKISKEVPIENCWFSCVLGTFRAFERRRNVLINVVGLYLVDTFPSLFPLFPVNHFKKKEMKTKYFGTSLMESNVGFIMCTPFSPPLSPPSSVRIRMDSVFTARGLSAP